MSRAEVKMHAKRWLTGIIAIPILISLIGFGPRWGFYLLLYLVSLTGLIEFQKITAPRLPGSVRFSTHLLMLLMFLAIYLKQILFLQFIVVLFALVPMTIFMFSYGSSAGPKNGNMGEAAFGPLYVGIPLAMLMHIDRYYPHQGNMWIFFLLAVIFASDTGAFYCGKLFGKHKLYEAISPGKTWEGAVGGVLSSIIVAIWFLRIIRLREIDAMIMFVVIALSVAGQIGDLCESMLKRNHGVKDSGNILPGHGGILDRIDGLLFAIPVLYVYLNYRIV